MCTGCCVDLLRRPEPVPRPVEQTFFYRLAKFAMRRAIPILLVGAALLIALGLPFSQAKWGMPDDRVLPASSSARQVGDQLRTDFADNLGTNVTIVIPDASDISAAEADRYASQLSQVNSVSSVSSPDGTFVAGDHAGPPSAPTGVSDGSEFLTVTSSAPLYSETSQTQLDALAAVPGPAARPALLTGTAAINRDTARAVRSRLPIVLAVIAVITFVLMFRLTGSVVLPLKTLLLNGLSLTATFGALVWIFQDGHLGALGTTATGTLVATMPALLFCIAFGLSMDYEVFLVSRIHEYWLTSDRSPADNDESVAPRGRPHRPGDHCRRIDHVDLLRRNDRRPGVVHANVRFGFDTGDSGRRNVRAHVARPGVHARDGRAQLVGTQTACAAARAVPDHE